MNTEQLTPVETIDAQEKLTEVFLSSKPIGLSLAVPSVAGLLAACGGGESGTGGGESRAATPSRPAPALPSGNEQAARAVLPISNEQAARFLLQAKFSASEADINQVRTIGYAGWLNQQSQVPLTRAWDWLDSQGYNGMTNPGHIRWSDGMADFMAWQRLMNAADETRQRAALALSEYFVYSGTDLNESWGIYITAAYWDVLAANAYGNFRTLLEAVTLNLGMGLFLDTRGNKKADGRGRLPDENYAREVMQLFTIGVVELNQDGTPKLNGQGVPIETYTSSDIANLANVFTGYGLISVAPVGQHVANFARYPMGLDNNTHSTAAISFLGVSIAQGVSAGEKLKIALDRLFNHPNVGPFFGRQMIQRLVTSNPSPAYVSRVAAAFNNNGSGVRGDLKAVWAAVLLDVEARSPQGLTDPNFGKLREPIVRLAQWARTFKVKSLAGSWKIRNLTNPDSGIGQSPLRSPSVFNFFRPGYIPPGTPMATASATAPEFQLVNEVTVSSYINYMSRNLRDGIIVSLPLRRTENTVGGNLLDIVPDYSALVSKINNTTTTDVEARRVATSIVATLNLCLCAGQLSTQSVTEIIAALVSAIRQPNKNITIASPAATKLDLVAAAILMVMTSPNYLIQK